jgi:uncharacterized protein (TIGR02145 family)
MSIIVTQQVINGRSVSLKVTPTISAAAFSTQSKTYRDQAEQFKITCEGVQIVLQNLIDNLDEVLLVQGSLPELLELHSKLTELLAVYAKLAIIENVNDHLIEIDSVSNNLAEILVIYTNITILQNIETNIDSVITVNTNITALLSISTNIAKLNTLYDNLTAILTLYDNIVVLQTLNTNITKLQDLHTNLNALLTVYNNLADILTVENSIVSINTLADNITKLQDLYTNLTALVTLYTNLSALLNVEADLTNINTVATDIDKVVIVADNIIIIQSVITNLQAILDAEGYALTATTKAGEASDSAIAANQHKVDAQAAELKAKKWADEAEDVPVETGKFSGKHWAAKAEDEKEAAEDVYTNIQSFLANFYDPTILALNSRLSTEGATVENKLRFIQEYLDELDTLGVEPTLLTYAGIYKLAKHYSVIPEDGSGDFTCVRATTPNRINKDGDTEVVPVNTPVIDWATGSPLLIVSAVGELTVTTPLTATKVVITINGVDTEYNNVFPTLTLPIGSISRIIATSGDVEYDLLRDYLLRVSLATGATSEQGAKDLKDTYEFLGDEGLLDDTELLFLSNAGMVQRTDGLLKYVRTAFDATTNNKDLDGSATATQQPRLVGGIAPNSKVAASNQNGETRFFTHTPISFAANEAWSVTVCLNWNKTNRSNDYSTICGNSSENKCVIGLNFGTNFFVFKNNETSPNEYISNQSSLPFIGKNVVITYVADGLGNLLLYINGDLKQTRSAVTSLFLNKLFGGFTSLYPLDGRLISHIIQSTALTAPQVTSLHTFLRTKYPEIESVVIGTQEWSTRNFEAVATPVGNVINNVTENGAVEKITNAADREFSSDTGFWEKGAGCTIGSGVASFSGTSVFLSKDTFLTIGKWYAITLTASDITGTTVFMSGSFDNALAQRTITAGTKTYILKAKAITFSFGIADTGTLTADDLSIKELNWSNATEIYNAVYAATAGTAEQKEYAALKEASMWCYYNNDASNGAIYGKLYNWYKVALLHRDLINYAMTGSNVVALPYNASKVYIVRINARTSGAGTVSINANGRGYSNVITLSGTDKIYELYVKGADGVIPTLTYTGTGTMTVTSFTMYEDLWGWRVPTSLDFTTLATYLGGTSAAGGKMKMTGLDYWNTPNTGATNESGFTGLGSGSRSNIDGSFALLRTWFKCHAMAASGQMGDTSLSHTFNELFNATIATVPFAARGYSIRLIKE